VPLYRSRHLVGPRGRRLLCALAATLLATGPLLGQAATAHTSAVDLSLPPVRWAEAAVAAEEHIVDYDHQTLLQYKFARRDSKGTVVRQVMESRDGSVARLLERNGQPLTAEENEAERARLQSILDSPEAFQRHVQRDDGSRSYAIELLRAMPHAMLWSYVAGQPQLTASPGRTVVLDFIPDPKYKPASLIAEGLTGIAGRVWVDADSHCVVRIQGRILHQVNFGWGGVLAKVREGGEVALEQHRAANGRWLYSQLVEHLTIREVLVHTVTENAETTTYDVEPLPAPIGYREAVQRLLSLPVPTH
jgi:hypothetical protein